MVVFFHEVVKSLRFPSVQDPAYVGMLDCHNLVGGVLKFREPGFVLGAGRG
jgi:hypothetical protein